jgi:hypothetical protein
MATPPTFVAGSVLTAAQLNAAGLWLVKTQTLPTATNVVTVTDAFSADYANYKIVCSNAVLTGIANVSMTLGSANSGYYSTRIYNLPNNGTVSGNGLNNTSGWSYAAQGSTNYLNVNMDVMDPFNARYTRYMGTYVIENGADSNFGTTSGHQASTTSFTAFTLTAGGGNFSGGSLRIYGYNGA